MLFEQFTSSFGDSISQALDILRRTVFVWLPILSGTALFHTWINYIRARWIREQGTVLLEIKLPTEIFRSPAAMELVLTQLYQAANPTYIDAYLIGKVRPWFSLELVSLGGEVHFYIWGHRKFKKFIENHIYAQYPNVEIYEVEDYAKRFPFDPENYPFWATYFKLTKADAYPLKTYIEYGLDKDPKEEFKIDPITSLIEYLGGLRKGEQAWIQILIRAHRKEGLKDLRLARPDWQKDIEKEIKKIMTEAVVDEEKQMPSLMLLDEEQRNLITAMRRNMGKFAFDSIVRGFYLAEKPSFDGSNISGLISSVRQFSSNTRNGFKLGKFSAFEYPWQDFQNMRRRVIERKMLDSYKHRSFFYPPHTHFRAQPYILTTEELATMFHFPGKVVGTPTVTRITSKKAEAPSNLPI
ncbi:MAG: hypothetical protein U1D31_03630 [Patescibacteria group bacterium]|nr:hypothetical protein [bacterium]MDZ4241183.1 hypothetical protein [Patescibacteria group bacterium]